MDGDGTHPAAAGSAAAASPAAAGPTMSSCRFCGSPMPLGAVRCNPCGLLQSWVKPCIQCGVLLPDAARYCPGCKSYQVDSRQCVSCGAYIAKRAKVCPQCSSTQVFGGYLNVGQSSLALVVALLAVISTGWPMLKATWTWKPDRSETHLRVIEMKAPESTFSEHRLLLLATNSGSQPSYLSRVWIAAGGSAKRYLTIHGESESHLIPPHTQKFFSLLGSFAPLKGETLPKLQQALILKANIVGTGEGDKPLAVEADAELLKSFVAARTFS